MEWTAIRKTEDVPTAEEIAEFEHVINRTSPIEVLFVLLTAVKKSRINLQACKSLLSSLFEQDTKSQQSQTLSLARNRSATTLTPDLSRQRSVHPTAPKNRDKKHKKQSKEKLTQKKEEKCGNAEQPPTGGSSEEIAEEQVTHEAETLSISSEIEPIVEEDKENSETVETSNVTAEEEGIQPEKSNESEPDTQSKAEEPAPVSDNKLLLAPGFKQGKKLGAYDRRSMLVNGTAITVENILQDAILSSALRRYLCKHYCEENFDFLQEIKFYTRQFKPNKHYYQMAHSIFEKYIKDFAAKQININAPTKKVIQNAIEAVTSTGNEELLPANLFNEAEEEVIILLELHSLSSFRTDALLKEALKLNDRISRVNKIAIELTDRTAMDLTSSEWRVLLCGAEKIKFNKGEIVVQHGKVIPYLYYIEAGALLFDNLSTKKAISAPGTLFGELSVLRYSLKSVFQVSVESSCIILLRIRVAYIMNLFKANPLLGIRFFCLVSKRFASIIQNFCEIEPSKDITLLRATLSSPDYSSAMKEVFPSLDKKLIVFECEAEFCSGVGVMKTEIRCNIIFTADTLYFYNAFGQTKDEIPFKEITNVKSAKSSLKVRSSKKKFTFRLKTKEISGDVTALLQSLLTLHELKPNERSIDDDVSDLMQAMPFLSPTDWLTLTTPTDEEDKSFMIVTEYMRGNTIIEQGKTYNALYCVLSGSCSVETDKRHLYDVGPDEIFGEHCFLFGTPSPITVIAVENNMRILMVNNYYIYKKLCTRHPKLAIRFFFHFSKVLADRACNLMTPKK